MMRGAKGYLLFAFLAYVFFLIVQFPADRAFLLFKGALTEHHARVEISGLEGAWWSGKAESAAIGPVNINTVRWAVHPLALLIGRLKTSLNFRLGDGSFAGVISAGAGGFTASNIDGRIPLQVLDQVLSGYGVRMNGFIVADLMRVQVRDGVITAATGTVAWHDAAVLQPRPLRLGDFKAELRTTDNGVRVIFSDNGGPLKTEGILLLKPDGGYDLQASFTADENEQPTLADNLRLLGRPDRNGTVTVASSGTLPWLDS